jgi:hypothetical protein
MTGNISAKRRAMSDASAWPGDVIYHRYGPPVPTMKRDLQGHQLVVEINTDDRREYALGSSWRRLYNALSRNIILRATAAFVFPTHELHRNFSRDVGDRPALVLANGVNFDGVPADLHPPDNDRLRAVFVGNPEFSSLWHGLDKLAPLVHRLSDWDFHLIGPAPSVGWPSNVVCHGVLSRDDYHEILRTADIAFSTLALHRNGMDEASPLKTREYLAFGIPTVIGYRDTDFPDGADFLLQIGNHESNVFKNISAITEFAEQ